jgi:two-component system alkaline phosphatase synthesis response regulator PhoP
MKRILLVEDELAIAESILYNLKKKYDVTHADDGRKAYDLMAKNPFDLVILDVRLPEIDGFELCQMWRREKNLVPILFLTARDTSDDIIFGLKSGGDDYLTKPFDLSVLLARVESLLRRSQWSAPEASAPQMPANGQTTARHTFGDCWIDLGTWQAQTKHGLVMLSRKEIGVMSIFLQSQGRVVTRRELLEKVWNMPKHPNERVVDNVIVALRRHFEDDSATPRHIINVRGTGYQFTT